MLKQRVGPKIKKQFVGKSPGPQIQKSLEIWSGNGAKYGPWLSVKRCVVQESLKYGPWLSNFPGYFIRVPPCGLVLCRRRDCYRDLPCAQRMR